MPILEQRIKRLSLESLAQITDLKNLKEKKNGKK